jgi:sugar (pentulose or hexulose) kinase
MKKVIAIFDIGKTNKKILLFDNSLNVVLEESRRFSEVPDDDNFMGDDIVAIEKWIDSTLDKLINNPKYNIEAVNFSTHGATVIYLDKDGNRLTPMYNYLKQLPKYIAEEVYSANSGVDEFSRKTASPAFGFLNSGLQIKWLQKEKPVVYSKVENILHFQQYLSYRFSKKITSEFTSVGSHTMLWDYDNNQYHPWVKTLGVNFPQPISGDTIFENTYKGHNIKFGIGIHDSSAALVPYLKEEKDDFLLVSTGTWGIVMNPFNSEPLTKEQLNNSCLCFMSYKQDQVKSSLFLLGLPHELNALELSKYFGVAEDEFKRIKLDVEILKSLDLKNNSKRIYFKDGELTESVDSSVDLSQFSSYAEGYHQLMLDLTNINIKHIESVLANDDNTKKIFVTGGFANNTIYLHILKEHFSTKKVYTSEINNGSALGAATVIYKSVFREEIKIDLGLKE